MSGILYYEKPTFSEKEYKNMKYQPDYLTEVVSLVLAIICFFNSVILLPILSIIVILSVKTKFETKKFK